MNSRKSFIDFIQETIEIDESFDSNDSGKIKDVIKAAIDHYDFKSFEKVEENKSTIYIDSMIEENMLSKIVEIASNGNVTHIEHVYRGHVVRNY